MVSISQHSPLSTLYTWPSDPPTSWFLHENRFSPELQSRLCGGKWLFQVGKQEGIIVGEISRILWIGHHFVAQFDHLGHGNGAGVSWCIVMVEEHCFLHQVWPFFFVIPCQIGAVILCSRVLLPFCPSQGIQRRSSLENPSKWWPLSFRPMQ